MTALPLRKHSGTTGATVIPFPIAPQREPDTLSRDPGLAARIPSLTQVTDELKTAIEAFVTEAYFKQVLTVNKSPDNPFDAVYLSRLNPDPIDPGLVARYLAITDRSDEVAFKDELED